MPAGREQRLRDAARKLIDVIRACQFDPREGLPSSVRHAAIELERALYDVEEKEGDG